MNIVKKAGIVAGAVAGGVIGGAVSVIGKMTNKKILDDVGESVVDSFIYAGGIAGNLASGAADVVIGNIREDKDKIGEGVEDLKDGGKLLAENWIQNARLMINEGGEIIDGIREGDTKKIKDGVKTIGQLTVVGALTVGAVRLKQDEEPLGSQGPRETMEDSANYAEPDADGETTGI